jgi:uncharacterized protein YjbI with pentapeptide repeats
MAFFRSSLKDNLGKHQLWLDSQGSQGRRFNAAGANFEKVDLSGVNLSRANLSGANLSSANLNEANLSEATLFGATLKGAKLNRANLSSALLSGVELQGAILVNAILQEAVLCEANLTGANLTGANLHKANLSLGIPEFVKVKNMQTLSIGSCIPFVAVNQTNLQEVNFSKTDLSEANLDFANLCAANLKEANLNKAKLFAANLNRANCDGANLHSADLFRITALDTNFSRAILTEACIESWQINSHTQFDDVICDSIYLKHILKTLPDYLLRKYCDRRPFNPKAIFAQGDFIKFLQQEYAISK